MCLCGVDYFSTLGYQPSIAFEGAGILAPIATLVLVAVTLFGALPIYCHVAGETPDGVGSVGMIERIFRGWTSKIFVLVLVGFAATDFVITKTLSAADATAHLLSNPLFLGSTPEWMQSQIAVTMFLLVLLSAMFIKGYGEVVGLATLLVVAYIGLTAIVIGAGLVYLVSHPELITQWISQISSGDYHLHHTPISGKGPWVALLIACLIFPKLALGMSGFETGVLHIHLIRGKEDDPSNAEGRIPVTPVSFTTLRSFLYDRRPVDSFWLLVKLHPFRIPSPRLRSSSVNLVRLWILSLAGVSVVPCNSPFNSCCLAREMCQTASSICLSRRFPTRRNGRRF